MDNIILNYLLYNVFYLTIFCVDDVTDDAPIFSLCDFLAALNLFMFIVVLFWLSNLARDNISEMSIKIFRNFILTVDYKIMSFIFILDIRIFTILVVFFIADDGICPYINARLLIMIRISMFIFAFLVKNSLLYWVEHQRHLILTWLDSHATWFSRHLILTWPDSHVTWFSPMGRTFSSHDSMINDYPEIKKIVTQLHAGNEAFERVWIAHETSSFLHCGRIKHTTTFTIYSPRSTDQLIHVCIHLSNISEKNIRQGNTTTSVSSPRLGVIR